MPRDNDNKLGNLFLKAREQQGLTQAEVAKRAGMTANSYARLERGESMPKSESLLAIISALKLDPAEVLKLK
jgi:transcriptional regulator with XRE-family HTH domain